MKKLIASIMMAFATIAFAHPHGENVKLENAMNYHSVKGALHTHLSVGTHDNELHAILGDLGMVDIEKSTDGFETANKMIKIETTEKGAKLKADILLFDRAIFNNAKFKPGMNFHSYNHGFPHLHIDFLKEDYTQVMLNEKKDLVFNGKVEVNEETKDKIFTEETGKFTIVIFGGSDKLSKIALLHINMDLFKLDADHHKY